MMAQATGDLGAVVRRWKCDEAMGKWRETASERQWSVTAPAQAGPSAATSPAKRVSSKGIMFHTRSGRGTQEVSAGKGVKAAYGNGLRCAGRRGKSV